jgi:virginiamycin B lyase
VVACTAALLTVPDAVAATLTHFSTGGATRFITTGPDGNLWFTVQTDRVGFSTTSGAVTEYTAGISAGAAPKGIATGPDGNLWFTEPGIDKVAKITTAGTVTEYGTGITAGSAPDHIVAGSDGNLWFTEPGGNRVARITTAGVVTEFAAGITAGSTPTGIAAGPDGNLWFTELDGGRVARITTTGTVTEFATGITAAAKPNGITAGADGNLWFAESRTASTPLVGRITPAGVVTEFPLRFNAKIPIEIAAVGTDFVVTQSKGTGSSGTLSRISTAGTVGDYSFQLAQQRDPLGITQGPDGNVWIAGELFSVGRLAAGTAPTAVTDPASGVTQADATLNGTVNPSGSSTAYAFEYGLTNAYGSLSTMSPLGSGSSAAAVSKTIHGLASGTTYHFRAVATSIEGTTRGGDDDFGTSSAPVAPVAFTSGPTSVGQTAATLNGDVNPNGAATSWHFAYGTTTGYGSVSPAADGGLPADNVAHLVSTGLTGLSPGTTYHYRLESTNTAGPGNGLDRTLTTYTSVPAGQRGSPVTTFGSGGSTTLSFGTTGFARFTAMAPSGDGTILAGWAEQAGTGKDFAVARLRADGTPDPDFGPGGTVVVDLDNATNSASAVAVADDGKIVVVGTEGFGTAGDVIRLKPDGTLDPGFNGTGKLRFTFNGSGSNSLGGVVVEPVTRRIVLGGATQVSGSSIFALARLAENGTTDAGFGMVTTLFGAGASSINDLARDGDGRLVAAGGAGGTMAAARYSKDGALEAGFGAVSISTGAARGIALQSDKKIVLAGGDKLVRLTEAGAGDSGFGTAGVVTFTVPGATATTLEDVAEHPNGGLLAVGSAGLNGDPHGFLVRTTAGGALDTAFGQGGLNTYQDLDGLDAVLPSGLVAGAKISSFSRSTTGTHGFSAFIYDPTTPGYDSCPGPITLTAPADLEAFQGQPYEGSFTTNGIDPAFGVGTDSKLPGGLFLAGNGKLSGSPTAAPGDYQFTIVVIDSRGCKRATVFHFLIKAPTTADIEVKMTLTAAIPSVGLAQTGQLFNLSVVVTNKGPGSTIARLSIHLPGSQSGDFGDGMFAPPPYDPKVITWKAPAGCSGYMPVGFIGCPGPLNLNSGFKGLVLAPGQSETIFVVGAFDSAGNKVIEATVEPALGQPPDPNPADNTATITTFVVSPLGIPPKIEIGVSRSGVAEIPMTCNLPATEICTYSGGATDEKGGCPVGSAPSACDGSPTTCTGPPQVCTGARISAKKPVKLGTLSGKIKGGKKGKVKLKLNKAGKKLLKKKKKLTVRLKGTVKSKIGAKTTLDVRVKLKLKKAKR